MKVSTVLALLPVAMAAPAKRSSPAPVLVPRDAQVIDGKYIIKMKTLPEISSITDAISAAISSITADADHRFAQFFNGFAASLTAEELENLRADPNVDFIEQDTVITMYATQQGADWGLARLSNQKPGGTSYTFDDSAGEGTCAFILDTGIEADHPEFEGRAKFLRNFVGDGQNTDSHGHGTHVAGTIGSKTYGVAKKTKLFGVKVLDGEGGGTTSGILAGMDFVAEEAKRQKCPKGSVVNMSLGGQKSDALNQAAQGITSAGLFLAVAAGNSAADAAGFSPASSPSACTVGATAESDTLAPFSNHGAIVDVLAPGAEILSTWIGGSVNTISGTSMASPHVAGIAAYFLGKGASIQGLCETIVQQGLKGVISKVPGATPNVLINNGGGNNATRPL